MLGFLDALLWRCPPRPKLLPWWGRKRGKFLQRVRTGRKAARAAANVVTLLLGAVDLRHIAAMRGTTREQCAEMLKAALGLADARTAADMGGHTYRLDIAITEMRPLAWWLDLEIDTGEFAFAGWPMLGILGFGHAWLQVEGALWEPGASRPTLEFAHRARWPRRADFRWGRFDIAMFMIHGTPPQTIDPLHTLCIKAAHAILQEIHAAVVR